MNKEKFGLQSQSSTVNDPKQEKENKFRRRVTYILTFIIIILLLSGCFFLFSTSSFIVPNFVNFQTKDDLGLAIAGTPNQVIVSIDDLGQVTLLTPQDISTTSSPTFTSLTLSDLQDGNLMVENGQLVINPLDISNNNNVTGDLSITNGGTGLNIFPTTNQILIGDENNNYVLKVLQAGDNVTITNTDNSIIISSTGGGGGGGGGGETPTPTAGDNCGDALCYIQNGNSFGETGVLGINDNFGLNLVTNSTVKQSIAANGQTIFTPDTLGGGGYGVRLLMTHSGNTVNNLGGGGFDSQGTITGQINYNTRLYNGGLTYNSSATSTGGLRGASLTLTINDGAVLDSSGYWTLSTNNANVTNRLRAGEFQVVNNGTAGMADGIVSLITNNGTVNNITNLSFNGMFTQIINNGSAEAQIGVGANVRNFGTIEAQTSGLSGMQAFYTQITNDGTIVDGGLTGVEVIVRDTTTGVVNNDLIGFHSVMFGGMSVGGSVMGLRIDIANDNIVNNAYGLSVGDIGDGAINNYGLYLGAISGGSGDNYSIYSAGGNAYFTDAVRVGNTTDTTAGNIRWTGADFEGRTAGAWVSLTGGSGCATCFQNGGNTFGATAVLGTSDTEDFELITDATTRLNVNSAGLFTVTPGDVQNSNWGLSITTDMDSGATTPGGSVLSTLNISSGTFTNSPSGIRSIANYSSAGSSSGSLLGYSSAINVTAGTLGNAYGYSGIVVNDASLSDTLLSYNAETYNNGIAGNTVSFRSITNNIGTLSGSLRSLQSALINAGTVNRIDGTTVSVNNDAAGVVADLLSGYFTDNTNDGDIQGTGMVGGLFITRGAGTTTNLYGLRVEDLSAQTISGNRYGLFIQNSDTNVITGNDYGIAVSGVATAGSANNYGLYIGAVANGTNNYSIYSAGGNAFLTNGLHVGNTSNTTAGNIRWTGSDFEGYDGADWLSFTAGGGGGDDCGSDDCFVNGGNAFGGTTLLGTSDSQDLNFMSNNIQALRVNIFGQILMGESGSGPGGSGTSYSDVLIASDTNPIISLEALGSGTSFFATNGNQTTIVGAEHSLEFKTNIDFGAGPIASGTTRMFIDKLSGFVGIGTSTLTNAFLGVTPATTGMAQINLASSVGVDPSAPNSGDLWWNGTNLNFFDGSDTIDLLAGGGGGGDDCGSDACFVNNGNAFGGLATIGTNDNNALAFEVNTFERMRITTDGYLSVGSTTALSLLQVSGDYLTTGGVSATFLSPLNDTGSFISIATLSGDPGSDNGWGIGLNGFSRDLRIVSGKYVGSLGENELARFAAYDGSTFIAPNASAHLNLAASNNLRAALNFADGVDPDAAAEGDLWWNGTNFYFNNGVTSIDLLSAGGGGGVTSITAGDGLSGGVITSTGTIAIDAPTCVGGEALTWTGTAFDCVSVGGGGGGSALYSHWDVDAPPSNTNDLGYTVLPESDEFNGTTLDPSWNTYDPGTVIESTNVGSGRYVQSNTIDSNGWAGIYKDLPAEPEWTIETKVTLQGEAFTTRSVGIGLGFDFATDDDMFIIRLTKEQDGAIRADRWENYNTWSGVMNNGYESRLWESETAFLRMTYDGSFYRFWWSIDGHRWENVGSEENIFDISGVTQFGLVAQYSADGDLPLKAMYDFVRVYDTALDGNTPAQGQEVGVGNDAAAVAFNQGGNAFGVTGVLGTTDAESLQFITNNTPAMTILSNGNVGIGTAAPDAKLQVYNGAITAGTNKEAIRIGGDFADLASTQSIAFYASNDTVKYAEIIQGLSGSGDGGTLVFSTKFEGGAMTVGLTIDENQNVSVTGNLGVGGACADDLGGDGGNDGCDLAETFSSSQSLQAGDVVKLDLNGGWKDIERTTSSSDGVIGVISTDPTLVMGNKPFVGSTGYPVGLAGVLPTKVIDENGLIHRGDYVTVSNTTGRAMKANAGDSTIGIALENQSTPEDKINILVSRNNSAGSQMIAQSNAQPAAMDALLLGFTQKLNDVLTIQGNNVTLSGILAAQAIHTKGISITSNRAGVVNVAVGASQTTVQISDLKTDAKVFLTPLIQVPAGYQYWVDVQNDQFVVHTNQPVADNDLKFNYLVID